MCGFYLWFLVQDCSCKIIISLIISTRDRSKFFYHPIQTHQLLRYLGRQWLYHFTLLSSGRNEIGGGYKVSGLLASTNIPLAFVTIRLSIKIMSSVRLQIDSKAKQTRLIIELGQRKEKSYRFGSLKYFIVICVMMESETDTMNDKTKLSVLQNEVFPLAWLG